MRAMTLSNHHVFWFPSLSSLPPVLPVGAVHLLHTIRNTPACIPKEKAHRAEKAHTVEFDTRMVYSSFCLFFFFSFYQRSLSLWEGSTDNSIILDGVVTVAYKDIPVAVPCLLNLRRYSFVRKIFVVSSFSDLQFLGQNSRLVLRHRHRMLYFARAPAI